MGETALNFGPDWIRALSTGSSNAPPPTSMPIPRYCLAEHRYGREEMLALIPKDIKIPNCLKQFPHLVRDKFQLPLALTPVTEEEQRLWTRPVNSELAFRASGKTGPGYSMHRTGRGGSVDRGRGRGRGSYYQRGLMHDDPDDSLPFTRPKPVERSLSASEKDHRWDDRDRRYDRTFSGRGGLDDTGLKQDLRGQNEYWRKVDKDDDGDWRSSGFRQTDKAGGRGTWRSNSERDRRDMMERTPPSRSGSGNIRGGPGPQQKQGNHSSSWKEDSHGNLPEWSVEESSEPDTVGTFDSSGAFLETKVSENTSLDEIYASDDADEGISKQDSPEAKQETSKKTPKRSTSPNSKQTTNKRNSKSSSDIKSVEEKSVQNVSEPSKTNSKNSKNTVSKSTENVIKSSTIVEKQPVAESESDLMPVKQPNVPTDASKTMKIESVILDNVRNSENIMSASGSASEEDAFAYHQKATENMVAQWTEEIEEQRVPPQTESIHPTHLEKDTKWFYQDPQGDIQGPFAPQEMFEWYNAGYFTSGLMVRRSCDEKFSKLGDLIEAWGCIPFIPGTNQPPVRVAASLPGPINQTIVPNPVPATTSTQLPKQDDQLLALQQQLFQQQLMQQQLMLRQAQMQQILAQLKQQDNFTSLNSQQQQQVLMQQFMAQQVSRPNLKPMPDAPNIMDPVNPLSLPLLGLPLPAMMKSMWQSAPGSDTWPVNVTQPPGGSIWDVDLTKQNSDSAESEKLKLLEEHEKKRKAEELRLQQERELEEKKKEELRRKQEEARILQELQKQEEERKRLEELQRHREEEQKRQEELRRLEEQRREEERIKQEELQRQEELRRQEELEELQKQEEQKRLEEEKRLEELKRKEEEKRRQEEVRKQQELRKQEEKRKKEEIQKKAQLEKEREKQLEVERQKEALRQKELEREERLRKERERKEKEEEDMRRLAELKIKSQGPVWGIQNNQTNAQLSLADIQRLQEEKEREEREEKARQQLLQQQTVKQVQQNKNGLSWAKRANDSLPAVKSLAEIQQEEAERLAQLHRMQKPQAPAPTVNSNAGVWGNSSHLNKITAPPATWNLNSVVSANNVATGGFWDDALNSTQSRKHPPKANTSDSAFPALAIPVQPANVSSNKGKNVRAKKEEDAVARLFGSHHKPTDEFTKWCTEAISSMPSSVDVPTFVAFLKDIESPYEVYDYVKSYFGEGKEPREFAKLFLEKRSKFRNQAKQAPSEDNTLWGPAPAITPTVNKTVIPITNDNDGNSNTKGKTKKRKGKMQKLDSSMLGFTVQSNPDRLNVGEIDHIENM